MSKTPVTAPASSNGGETASLLSTQPRVVTPSGPSPYHSLPPPVTYEQESAMQAADRRARIRFFEALVWGVGIWLTVGLLTGGVILGETEEPRHKHPRDAEWVTHHSEGSTCRSVPATKSTYVQRLGDMTPFALVGALRRPLHFQSSTTTFPLALTGESSLSIVGMGEWSTGAVVIEADSKEGRVEVEASWNDGSLMEKSRVCVVEGGDAVAIQVKTPTRRRHYRNRLLSYSIKVYLPPLLSLDTLNVTGSFSVVSKSTTFPRVGSVDVQSSNRPITFAHLIAQSVALNTTNALVTLGDVFAKTLHIVAANSGIHAEHVKAESSSISTTNGDITGHFLLPGRDSVLIMATSNAPIDVTVALMQPQDREGRYTIDAKDSNGKVDVWYTTQAVGSHLESKVVTTNARARVGHAKEYQGSFGATTSNAAVDIEFSEGVQHRVDESSRTHQSGVVWKGEDDEVESRGRSVASSVNAPVEMQFV